MSVVAGFRLHHQSQALQLKFHSSNLLTRSRWLIASSKHDASVTHFVLIGTCFELEIQNDTCFFSRIVVPSDEQGIANVNHFFQLKCSAGLEAF